VRLLATSLLLLSLPNVCTRLRKSEAPDASAFVDAAPPDAGAIIIQDAAADAAAAARVRAQALLADIRWMIDKGVSTNPAKAGEGDLASKCSTVESMRASQRLRELDDAAALCAFDVPLVHAGEAMRQLHYSPSQASRRLQCDVASREIARARAARPSDPRVRKAEAQRIEACR
jgi:hypothetical protein